MKLLRIDPYWIGLNLALFGIKILAEANTTIPTENHNPKLNPKIAPTTITPKATKPPIVIAVLKNEKPFCHKNYCS